MGSLACRAGENKRLLQNATYGLAALKALLDSILEDTGTTLEVKLDAIKALLDSILEDTGTTLEVKLDAIDLSLTPQRQADIVYSQASPVQNTWYTALPTTLHCRIYGFTIQVATTGEDLEVRFTVDGQVYVATRAAAAGTTYIPGRNAGAAYEFDLGTTHYESYQSFLLEGQSIMIEYRKTSNNGTGTISGRIKYSRR